MVSENLAREFWGTPTGALGKRVTTTETVPWREVVGVVEDVYNNGVHNSPPTIVHLPPSWRVCARQEDKEPSSVTVAGQKAKFAGRRAF